LPAWWLPGPVAGGKCVPVNWAKAWRAVVPREHGSWFFVLEPLLLVLPVFPTWPSAILSGAALLGFLARRPLVSGWGRTPQGSTERRFSRGVALCLLAFAGLMVIPVLVAFRGRDWLLLSLMLGLGGFASACEQHGVRRSLPGELAGVLAFGLLPGLLVSVAGASLPSVRLFVAVLCLRSVPSFLGLRAFLRARKAGGSDVPGVLWPALTAWLLSVLCCWQFGFPIACAIFGGLFLVRTLWLLSRGVRVSATALGIIEAVLGIAHALVLSASLRS